MELLRFTGLECHYGARTIFSNVDGVLNDGERIALVGGNGAGKSSLLRLLAGAETPYAGKIVRAKDATLGYLAQSVADETSATLNELVESALHRIPDEAWGLQRKRLYGMLDAFGFRRDDYDRPLREFSGGQRSKAAIAHVLIDQPDVLILDEPTNHLDIETVRWLESFIAGDKRAYIVVSHDRYFLDRVATRVWEMDRGRLHTYSPATPAYSRFVEARNLRLAAERAAYDEFVEERNKRRATIAGLRATHTSSDYSQVRSREKQLARVESEMEAPEPPPEVAPIRVRLAGTRRANSGFALEARDLAKSYDERLFRELGFDLQQDGRLAIVGPNGAGKSTLLKIVAGLQHADRGVVRFNPAVKIAYYAQSAQEQIDVEATAVDAVMATGAVTEEEARRLLGRMRISGEAADKPVRAFSGGERRRILLARLMARKADVLLLDEPTNDLDISSREALESVLSEYEGAIVVVSHDRYLLARLAERVLWIDRGSWGIVEGYDAYERLAGERERAREDAARERSDAKPSTSRLTPLKVRSQLTAKIARIEREIERLDARKAELERLFALPQTYDDRVQAKELEAELATLRARSESIVVEWESAIHEFEALLS